MKKLAVAIFLLLYSVPAFGQTSLLICNRAIAQAGVIGPLVQTTLISVGDPNRSIYFCGWNIGNTGNQSATITLVSGTGTNCGTDTTQQGVNITVGQNQSNIDHVSVPTMAVPKGYDVCWSITGTATINATFYYGIF